MGDTGWITTDTGRAEVLDTTYARPGLAAHAARIVEGSIEAGQVALAAIDVERRDAIRRNHTGTHILHWALRKVLGEGVKQQGSLVAPDRLRFDFGPSDALTPDQIRAIEDLANAEILANPAVRHYETTKEEAARLGAIAFFGDKYGDIVRVLEAGPHSTELCGGTHVRALGDIGPVKIVKEESIGSNLRRIEAVTGTGPVERLREVEAVLAQAADALNVSPSEVLDGARKRADELKALRKELDEAKRKLATGGAGDLAAQAVDGVVVARVDGLDPRGLRELALAVRDRSGIRAVVLAGAPEGGGAALVAAVAPDSGLHAGELIAEGRGPSAAAVARRRTWRWPAGRIRAASTPPSTPPRAGDRPRDPGPRRRPRFEAHRPRRQRRRRRPGQPAHHPREHPRPPGGPPPAGRDRGRVRGRDRRRGPAAGPRRDRGHGRGRSPSPRSRPSVTCSRCPS